MAADKLTIYTVTSKHDALRSFYSSSMYAGLACALSSAEFTFYSK